MTGPRRLPFEGAQNFRDLGGYPVAGGRIVRGRTIYRSDNLAALTDTDLDRLAELGLRTIVDLRVPFERERARDRLPPGSVAKTVRIDLQPKDGDELLRGVRAGTLDAEEVAAMLTEQYRRFVLDHAAELRRVFDAVLASDGLPLLVHCTSGKDRTGFAVAMILLALGADRETVLEDFLLTNEYRREVAHFFGPATPPAVVELLTSVQRVYLDATFDQIDRSHGAFDAYLRDALGIDDDARARLTELLTEPR